MSLTLNPMKVTVAANTFYSTAIGGVQGFYKANPTVRNLLRSGVVAGAETTALWGGCAITAALPTGITAGPPDTGVADSLEALLTLASAETNISGFTVWDQSHATVLNPSVTNAVPLASAGDGTNPGGGINWFPLGSGAEIWVQCTQAVATALRTGGGWGAQSVYWDYTNQVLLNAAGGTAIPVKVTGISANGNAMVVTSGASWNYAGYAALIQI